MNWTEYKKESARTVSDLDNDHFTHACMGIATECIELYVAKGAVNTVEEMGDIFWYIAMLCRIQEAEGVRNTADEVMKYRISKQINTELVSNETFLCAAGELLNEAKRVKFYKSAVRLESFSTALLAVVTFLFLACKINDIKVEKVWEDNIIKLRKRYPEKFSTERAEERDIEGELNHI